MITTAFQVNAFQNNTFQIVHTLARPLRAKWYLRYRIPASAVRVITIKPVKNRRAE